MPVPDALLLKLMLLPVHADWLIGCVPIEAGLLTVKIAAFEVSPLGSQVEMTTRYWLLLLVPVMADNDSVAVLAPLMSVQVVPPSVLTCHW